MDKQLILLHCTRGQIKHTFLHPTLYCTQNLSIEYKIKGKLGYPYFCCFSNPKLYLHTERRVYGLAGMYDILNTCAGNSKLCGMCMCGSKSIVQQAIENNDIFNPFKVSLKYLNNYFHISKLSKFRASYYFDIWLGCP